MVRAGLAGDFAKARFLNDKLHDVHPLLYAEGNPVGIKASAAILGLCENELRLPLVPMVGGNYTKLKSEMKKAAAYRKA